MFNLDNKILLITNDYAPRTGGVARYYQGLKNSLSMITVLTSVPGELENRLIRRGWNWPIWPKWLPLLWLVPYYKFKIKARWLAAGEILPIGTALMFIRLTLGWPYIVFLHGYDIILAQHSAWKKWLTRRILCHAHCVVVNSEFTKSLARSAGARDEQVVIVYPCTNLTLPAPTNEVNNLREQYGLVGKTVLLTVARLVRRKGIDRIIELIPRLTNEFPNLVYVIVGDGPEREELESRIKNQEFRILFVGEVVDQTLAAWHTLADIFVLTPRNSLVDVEGFGIVYLEAQAAGKPVVGSRVGGVPEAVGQVGYLSDNEEDIFIYLSKLLCDQKLREQIGGFGKDRVRTQFTWDIQSNKLAKFL